LSFRPNFRRILLLFGCHTRTDRSEQTEFPHWIARPSSHSFSKFLPQISPPAIPTCSPRPHRPLQTTFACANGDEACHLFLFVVGGFFSKLIFDSLLGLVAQPLVFALNAFVELQFLRLFNVFLGLFPQLVFDAASLS
jgi:hypothetical protein